MGNFQSTKFINVLCCNNNTNSINRDVYLDNKQFTSTSDLKKIKLIQAVGRGVIYRNKMNCNSSKSYTDSIKEISMDYSTEEKENNPLIIRLNNLLPKFELSEKETYDINNSKLKIVSLLYPDKSIYKGMINEEGLREGFGKYYLSNGSIYKGFFHNNKMQGRGRLLNVNGFVYEGEFDDGVSSGYGKYVALDGTTYKGTWKNDKQCGLGDIIYPDGSHYTGNFLDGKKYGNGKLIFQDQNFFEGNFVNNEIVGEGIYHWKDGRIYIGNWTSNKMNGYGIFAWPDKKKYYGHYINNYKEGFGQFFWGDGLKFEGFWKDGKQHGYGIIKGKDNTKYGQWSFGKPINKIEDIELQKEILKKIDDVKKSDEFYQFKSNMSRYEKQISEGSSNQETGRGNNKILQNEK